MLRPESNTLRAASTLCSIVNDLLLRDKRRSLQRDPRSRYPGVHHPGEPHKAPSDPGRFANPTCFMSRIRVTIPTNVGVWQACYVTFFQFWPYSGPVLKGASQTQTARGTMMYPTISTSVSDIITASWNISKGTVVPETDDIVMKNGGRRVEATYAYADLADSSKIAQALNPEVAAKIIRSFVNSATRIFRFYDGEIRSFDGDRVMAIFIGEKKNWNAVRSAYAISWAVHDVIRPKLKEHWDWSTTPGGLYNISHRVGIDTGESLIVRGGARDNSDLISVGAAPNIAAKLSDLKFGHSTYATDRVIDALDGDDLLYYENNRLRLRCFERLNSRVEIGGTYNTVYGSSVSWGI